MALENGNTYIIHISYFTFHICESDILRSNYCYIEFFSSFATFAEITKVLNAGFHLSYCVRNANVQPLAVKGMSEWNTAKG